MTARCFAVTIALSCAGWAQTPGTCSCGKNPPKPKQRTIAPYAGTPDDMRPWSKFSKPYFENYTTTVEYNGGARDVADPDPATLDAIRIGFLGPIENHPDAQRGRMMLMGSQMAVDEANARGGYGGKPFKLLVHNDQATWGSSSNEVVKMTYDEQVWGMLGSISGDSTHIALRASLKSELPIVNGAATDPTIPETIIPWYFSAIQDDRVQCYTLARRIYTDLGIKRVAILRVNDRYGRFGVGKFKDASRRLGHPVVIEQKYLLGDTDFGRQLRVINDSRVEAIVLWSDAEYAAPIVKQMRAMGMKQRVFGSFRVLGDALFAEAGPAADGMEFVYPYDPNQDRPAWLDFKKRFAAKFDGKTPDAFASLAFDTMSILLHSICEAGLNRGRIRDAFYSLEQWHGVTADMVFDPNAKNVAPLYLGTVKPGGNVEYRRYPMQLPYAEAEGKAPAFAGPAPADAPEGGVNVVLFGKDAARLAADPAVTGALGPRYKLVPVETGAQWGKSSSELVKAMMDERTIGVVATERESSHLAEQLGNKLFVPVVAVSADRALTSMGVPWIFRLPVETAPAEALKRLVDAAGKAGTNRGRVRDELARTL